MGHNFALDALNPVYRMTKGSDRPALVWQATARADDVFDEVPDDAVNRQDLRRARLEGLGGCGLRANNNHRAVTNNASIQIA